MPSLSWSSSSWRLSLAERDKINQNKHDHRIDPRKKPMLSKVANNTSNEPNSNGPRKRYPFSSLLSSGSRNNNNNNNNSALLRSERRNATTENSNGTEASNASSFRSITRGNTILRNRTAATKKAPTTTAFRASIPPASSITEASSEANAVSSDVGSDLLGFGASVEFQEDHRRQIHAETMKLEASNETTKEAITKEKQTETQLRKDLGRAKSELLSLNKGAEDQLESANMFLTLTRNLDKELRLGIIEPTKPTIVESTTPMTPSGTETNIRTATTTHAVTPDERRREADKNENDNGENLPHPRSNQEILIEKESRADEMLRTLQSEKKSLEAIQADINSIREKQLRLDESMGAHDLQETLERAREDDRRLESELLQDRDIKATRIVEIQQLRESCGAKAQKCTDLTKKLNENKKSNIVIEGKLRDQLQTVKAEVSRLLEEKEKTLLQIEVENRNLEKAMKEIDDYHYYCKAVAEYEKEKAARSERKKELLVKQAEAKRKLKEFQEAEQASLLRKQQAEEAMRQAEARKKANDEVETKIIIPGKAKMTKLAERKMKLAERIGEASKTAEKEQAKECEALAAKMRAKNDAIDQVQKLEIEYKAKQEEKEAATQKQEEFTKSQKEKIASCQSMAKKFEDMHEAEMKAYETRLEEGRKRWSKKLLRRTEEQERIAEAHAFKREVMEQGILLLKDAKKAERKAHTK